MHIGLIGAGGRMGRAIAYLVAGDEKLSIAAEIRGESDATAVLPGSLDVLIDFSTPAALPGSLDLATRLGLPVLIGTTGLSPDQHAAIDAAARTAAILQAANTALGVNLLRILVEEAARRLGPGWDIEIVEMHHRQKLDAPSGTALLLGAAAARGRGEAPGARDRLDRLTAGPQERTPGDIHYAALRGGTVAGEHSVIFAGDRERIELSHRAEDRLVFAQGALTAARWLIGRPPGRYTMADLFANQPAG